MSTFRSTEERAAAIATRAYLLWEERGRPEGSPENDWYRAESEIDRASREDAEPAPSDRAVVRGRRRNR